MREPAPERRQRILEAARRLILSQGARATTMEALAREAQIAKPTLYAYFRDKEAVLGALADACTTRLTHALRAALAGEGDAARRIGAALAIQHKTMARLGEGSPHAEELYGPAARIAEAHAEGAVSRALAEAGVDRPRSMARLLLAAAQGIAGRATDPAEIGPAVRLVTERLLRPELALAAARSAIEPAGGLVR